MKLIKASTDKTIVSLSDDDFSNLLNVFIVLSGTKNPNWDETDEGMGEPSMNSELFMETWRKWNDINTEVAAVFEELGE